MASVERLVKTTVETSVRRATMQRIVDLKVLDPSITLPQREASASVLINEKYPGVTTIKQLVGIESGDVSGDAEKASAALNELAEAHYELFIHNGMEVPVIAGSRTVDMILPAPMKGLGMRIADCAFVDEEGVMDNQGQKIRKLMERVDKVKHTSPDDLGKKVNDVYRSLKQDKDLNPIESDRVDMSKDVACEYLEKVLQLSVAEDYDYHRAFTERILPPESEMQLLARKALDMIESSNVDSHDLSIQSLESWLLMLANNDDEEGGKKIVNERLQLEIGARLVLHNTSLEMRHCVGHLEAKDGSNIQDAAGRLKRAEMLMSRDHLGYLMRGLESDSGIADFELPVGKAVDLFQLSISDYQNMLDRMVLYEGSDLKTARIDASSPVLHSVYFPDRFGNFFMENDSSIKKRMRNFMATQVMEQGMTLADAKKAVELAEDLMWAAGNASKANLAFAWGDKYSELIHFGELLSDDAPKGKNVGAKMIRGQIETLIVPWWDFISGNDDPHVPIFHNARDWKDSLIFVNKDGIKDPKVLPFKEAKNWGKEIIYANAKGKLDWETFHAIIVAQKAQLVKNLLLSNDAVDPKKVGVSMFADINDAFSKIDPYDQKTLRPWVAAIMLMNSTADSRTVWQRNDVERFAKSAVASLAMTGDEKKFLDDMDAMAVASGKPRVRKRFADSFLTKDQLKWVLDKSKAKSNAVIFNLLNNVSLAIDRVEFK